MHINLELLECVYLTSAMLLEIPYMAAHEFDYRRRPISKSFHYQLRMSDKQSLVGKNILKRKGNIHHNSNDHKMGGGQEIVLKVGEFSSIKGKVPENLRI